MSSKIALCCCALGDAFVEDVFFINIAISVGKVAREVGFDNAGVEGVCRYGCSAQPAGKFGGE